MIIASIGDTAENIITTFGVDLPMLIAQVVNFLIVALVIWRFGLRRILTTINEREKQIADSLKNADRIKLELEETEKKTARNFAAGFSFRKEDSFCSTGPSKSVY